MHNRQIFDDKIILAGAAAKHAVSTLQKAITEHGTATWVLAGGSTPNLAYEYITENYLESVDWQKVTFVIGDERIAPLTSPDNNWHGIEDIFLHHVQNATFLRPHSDQSAENTAADYENQLTTLPTIEVNGIQLPRFDLVWLGMGPDGHTLSLFPGHDSDLSSKNLVIPIHNSPKPPADRISLSLTALAGAQSTIILAAGSEKAEAVANAQHTDSTLPIALAAHQTNAQWFLDQSAAGSL